MRWIPPFVASLSTVVGKTTGEIIEAFLFTYFGFIKNKILFN